jgi:predicted CopG family antitoxin
MSPTIEINDGVKKKLDEIKEKSGSETYSDAINICLIQLKLLEDNQGVLSEIRDSLKTLGSTSQPDQQMIDALRNYVNSEDTGDKLAMFVRLVDSKANLHKLLVSQGKVREAQNVHSEWKALVEVANLLGVESQLEMIKKE